MDDYQKGREDTKWMLDVKREEIESLHAQLAAERTARQAAERERDAMRALLRDIEAAHGVADCVSPHKFMLPYALWQRVRAALAAADAGADAGGT